MKKKKRAFKQAASVICKEIDLEKDIPSQFLCLGTGGKWKAKN